MIVLVSESRRRAYGWLRDRHPHINPRDPRQVIIITGVENLDRLRGLRLNPEVDKLVWESSLSSLTLERHRELLRHLRSLGLVPHVTAFLGETLSWQGSDPFPLYSTRPPLPTYIDGEEAPDAYRYDASSAEAEAEMAAWKEIIKKAKRGRGK